MKTILEKSLPEDSKADRTCERRAYPEGCSLQELPLLRIILVSGQKSGLIINLPVLHVS